MAIRNLDNVWKGSSSPIITFRVDKKTREILKKITNLGVNRSEFIRNAILEYYESEVLGGKK